MSQFGSGYAWLVIDRNDQLKIIHTANQDCPLSVNLFPVLVVDVWEHAYYLTYHNKRADYLEQFMKIIDWDMVEKIYHSYYV